MISAEMLLLISFATPVALLLACGSRRARKCMPTLFAFAPLPALATALWAVMIFKNLIRYCKPHVAQQFYGAFGKLIQEAVDLGAERFEVIGPAMQVGHVLAQFAPEFFNGVAPRGISG